VLYFKSESKKILKIHELFNNGWVIVIDFDKIKIISLQFIIILIDFIANLFGKREFLFFNNEDFLLKLKINFLKKILILQQKFFKFKLHWNLSKW